MKIDSVIKLQIEIIKKANVKEIGYTKLSCIGYSSSSKAYLFWINEKKIYVQKFEDKNYNRGSIKKFKPIEIRDSTFFTFYENNKDNIKTKKVGRFKTKPDSTSGNLAYSHVIMRNHSCHRNFTVLENNEYLKFSFDFFDLREFDKKKVYASKRNYTKEEIKKWEERGWEGMKTEVIHENYPKRNINFELNNELKLVEWDKIMSNYIETLESENNMVEIIDE